MTRTHSVVTSNRRRPMQCPYTGASDAPGDFQRTPMDAVQLIGRICL